MKDSECVSFLQWALPRLRLRWPGYRKVRGQVCKRVSRRLRELELGDVAAYKEHLLGHADEWGRLDTLCRVTISRFYRDRGVFDLLGQEVLPELCRRAGDRGDRTLRSWCAGCASGEEPYALALVWHYAGAASRRESSLEIVATDSDEHLLKRARDGSYEFSSLKDLPGEWRDAAFEKVDSRYVIRKAFREAVDFRCQDIRGDIPEGCFDLILCRNLVFTYFEESLQRELLIRLMPHLAPGGALVVGIHEALPPEAVALSPWFSDAGIYRHLS